MAKGNILLGMGRGKLGDIVLTRIDGQQIARPRNRQPKNPRTNKQLYQRAVMATVMQAYSAGIKIFDHSFEGKSVGAANQRYFMKINAKALRASLAYLINSNANIDVDNAAAVCAPGVTMPVPNRFIVSEGSLTNPFTFGTNIVRSSATETVKQYSERMGLVANDLFTFVSFFVFDSYDPIFKVIGQESNQAMVCPCQFYYARYVVKPTAFNDDDVITNLGQVLELSESNFTPKLDISEYNLTYDEGSMPDANSLLGNSGLSACSDAWIRSRLNEDLRSSETMRHTISFSGIQAPFALDAWKQGSANLGDSDLILEGGDE